VAPLAIPEGFRAIEHSAPFGAHVGPFYEKDVDGALVRAFRVSERHTNAAGVIHGGMLTTFADIVLAQAGLREVGGPIVTVRMVSDFVAAGKLGAWVEGIARVQRRTRTLVFVDGELAASGRVLMTASGVFKIVDARHAEK
jgi:uncharacterized protein (TIGR00369 family)